MPSADHTYQADIWPRSSLPIRPSGRGLFCSSIVRRTIDWVLAGAPAYEYTYGALEFGSLPMKAYGSCVPAFSWVKKVSNRDWVAVFPPNAVTTPPRS